MSHTITLKALSQATHDTHVYTFERPEGLNYEAGQATELTLDREGWRDEGRPFTFTSLPENADEIEFTIKSYPDHDGVTEQLPKLEQGAQMEMGDVFGAITDQGPGVFLAAGAGVTPFIAILRKRAEDGTLQGCHLMFANKTPADIILRSEWDAMADLKTTYVLSDEGMDGAIKGKVDRDLLADQISDFSGTFYLCGPGAFVDDVRDALKALGAEPDNIITEDGW